MSRRDSTIVAWHEVPGNSATQKSRPVGHGMISIGVRTDSMRSRSCKTLQIYVVIFRPAIQFFPWQPGISQVQETLHYIQQLLEHHRTRTFEEDLAFLKKARAHFDEKYLWD
jgi:hypothetical protein